MAGAGREFDIVVYGATGYTGRLVAAHMLSRYGEGGEVRWALAGRTQSKLEQTRDQIGASEGLPIIVAAGDDAAALDGLVQRTRVVATLAGPYQLYGSSLVAACARRGTDYLDLAGEVDWIAAQISAHHQEAEASGARLVFSAGFGSTPFDLGVWLVQEEALRRTGRAAPRVRGRIRRLLGFRSAGTMATSDLMTAALERDPKLQRQIADPFAFTPGFTGPPQPPADQAYEDSVIGAWVSPFPWSAQLNSKVIHRTNALLAHAWGAEFLYDEMAVEPVPNASGERPRFKRARVTGAGEGPSQAERESGYYDLLFVAECVGGGTVRAFVQADLDPGYGSTAKILAESAICLARDVTGGRPGGCLTPVVAMGRDLVGRLQRHAGLKIGFEGTSPL